MKDFSTDRNDFSSVASNFEENVKSSASVGACTGSFKYQGIQPLEWKTSRTLTTFDAIQMNFNFKRINAKGSFKVRKIEDYGAKIKSES